MLKKRIVQMLSAVMVVASLSGCSSTGEEKEAAQGVTDTTIKVGNSIATSGALAPVGVPYKAGMEAYFKMLNESGGVNGRTIDYVHQDDEFSPEKGMSILDKLINDDQIFALVGHFGTPVVGATLNDIKEIGIPSVYFATGTGILYNEDATEEGRNVYPVQPVYPMEGRIMTSWAIGEFNATKIGVIYTNDDAGKDLLSGIEKEAKNQGVEVIAEQVAIAAEDVSAQVTKIKDAGVDTVIIAGIQSTFPQIAKELGKQGNTAPAITTYVNADLVMANSVKNDTLGKYDIYANAWVDMSTEDMPVFQEWVAKVSNEDYSLNSYAMTGWIAADIFVQGLERVEGDLTWDTYMDALESSPVKNPFGGELDFSNGQRLGTGEMSLLKMNDSEVGWENYKPMMSMEEILAQ